MQAQVFTLTRSLRSTGEDKQVSGIHFKIKKMMIDPSWQIPPHHQELLEAIKP
jgi:hypothetical protein